MKLTLCAVHDCISKATKLIELYSLDKTMPVCDKHAKILREIDLEAIDEALDVAEVGLPAKSSMAEIVERAAIFSEYEGEGPVPTAQAAMATYSKEYIKEYERDDAIVEVTVVDKSKWAKDRRFKDLLPHIVGEEDLEYVDLSCVDKDLYVLFEKEEK